MTDKAQPLKPGAKLGDYLLNERLAEGGMAEIWSATEALKDGSMRAVALKLLLPELSKDQSFRTMFYDEVSIASRLHHKNIVRVHGAEEHSGVLFQAMELVQGKDLRQLLAEVVRQELILPVPLALYIIKEIAKALSYAHQKKSEEGKPLEIVHRDVSPHNIIIGRDGQVKLLDFGIARAAERLARTRAGVVKGKVAYMAPEQALALEVTAQTDIYALGVVLWESLALQRLIQAANEVEAMEMVVRSQIPPIEELNPEVGEAEVKLLKQMLSQRMNGRPETMAVVEESLHKILLKNYPEDSYGKDALSDFVVPLFDPSGASTMAVEIPVVPSADATLAQPLVADDLFAEETPFVAQEIEQVATPTSDDTAPGMEALIAPASISETGEVVVGAADTIALAVPSLSDFSAGSDPGEDTYPNLELEALPSASTPNGISQEGQRVLRPTSSAIQHAVDAVPTIPLMAELDLPDSKVSVVSESSVPQQIDGAALWSTEADTTRPEEDLPADPTPVKPDFQVELRKAESKRQVEAKVEKTPPVSPTDDTDKTRLTAPALPQAQIDVRHAPAGSSHWGEVVEPPPSVPQIVEAQETEAPVLENNWKYPAIIAVLVGMVLILSVMLLAGP